MATYAVGVRSVCRSELRVLIGLVCHGLMGVTEHILQILQSECCLLHPQAAEFLCFIFMSVAADLLSGAEGGGNRLDASRR
ncbi:uncharacterized protein LOC115008703 isoform X2 [Cottoperca gobio]|uniref:Uncharacterized protein LOC115008703 isoform X2 n=1 Tax=Cottoperca gobio TaxID=56716 RepID=A0A6J2PRW1_COTGO|nr:uncharacterized protein LOC115008703 isoform X2 [Cottoperca gobio]